MQNFGIEDRSAGNITVRIDLKVNNPNNYNIKIKKSSLDVFVNGAEVGKTKMKNNIVLKKNHQDVYPLYLTLSEKELKRSALVIYRKLSEGLNESSYQRRYKSESLWCWEEVSN